MECSIIVNDVSKAFRGNNGIKERIRKVPSGAHLWICRIKCRQDRSVPEIICGLVNPDSGTVEVEGKKLGEEIDFPESMGLIIEQPGFLYTCSGFENLRYLASIKHKIDKEKIRETMAMVGLDWRMKKWVGHCHRECGSVWESRRRSWKTRISLRRADERPGQGWRGEYA